MRNLSSRQPLVLPGPVGAPTGGGPPGNVPTPPPAPPQWGNPNPSLRKRKWGSKSQKESSELSASPRAPTGTPEVSGPLMALGGGHVWLAGSRQGEGPQGRSTRAGVPPPAVGARKGRSRWGKKGGARQRMTSERVDVYEGAGRRARWRRSCN